MDSNGKGILTKQDLQSTLHRFILPISKQEFNKLWSRYEFQVRARLHQSVSVNAKASGTAVIGNNRVTPK